MASMASSVSRQSEFGGRKRSAAEASEDGGTSATEEAPKRGRGRPAVDPSHAGQFTAEKMSQKARLAAAERAAREGRRIADPTVLPGSARARKVEDEARALAQSYEREPTIAVSGIMTDAIQSLVKALERSKNLKGSIVGEMWRAVGALTAGTNCLSDRASGAEWGADDSAAVAGVDKRAYLEIADLRREVEALRRRNRVLEEERAGWESTDPRPLPPRGPKSALKSRAEGPRPPRSPGTSRGWSGAPTSEEDLRPPVPTLADGAALGLLRAELRKTVEGALQDMEGNLARKYGLTPRAEPGSRAGRGGTGRGGGAGGLMPPPRLPLPPPPPGRDPGSGSELVSP